MNVRCILVSVLLIKAVECESVPSLTISNITVTCDGILIEWAAPEQLEDGSNVTHYTLHIDGPNITYQTSNTTSVLVSYDGLQYNEEYNISLYASYCGREGNRTFGTIRTATVPQIMNQTSFILKIKDHSHATVTFITKVITPGCLVSYPTSVDIEIHQLQELLIESSMEVNVTEDGTITFEIELPVDKHIVGTLFWKNSYFESNYRIIEFDTNQLQSCTFTVDRDGISFNCVYANGSTLWGCTVIATDSLTSRQYLSSSRAGSGGSVVSVVCDSVYNVKCEGALDPTGVIYIGYSGTQYSTVLFANCTTVITVSSAFSSPGNNIYKSHGHFHAKLINKCLMYEMMNFIPTYSPLIEFIGIGIGIGSGVIMLSVVFTITVATGIYILKRRMSRTCNRYSYSLCNINNMLTMDTDKDEDTEPSFKKIKAKDKNLLGHTLSHTLSVNQPEFVCQSTDDEEEYNEFASHKLRAKPVRKDCDSPLLEHSATSEDYETSTFPPTLVSGTFSQENSQNLSHGLECEDLTSESQNKMER